MVKKLGIYHEISKQQNELTIEKIAMRVLANKEALQKKVTKKVDMEQHYYEQKKAGLVEN